MDVHGATETVKIANHALSNAGAVSSKEEKEFNEAVNHSTTLNNGSQPSRGSSNSFPIILATKPPINLAHPTGKQGAHQSSENTGESSIMKGFEKVSEHPATDAVSKVAPEVAKAMAEKSGGGIWASIKGALGTILNPSLGGAISKVGGSITDVGVKSLNPEVYKGVESLKQTYDAKKSNNWGSSYGNNADTLKRLDKCLNGTDDQCN